MSPRGGDDPPAGEEQVRHLDRLVEKAAGVRAQIEHDARHRGTVGVERRAQLAIERQGGALVERGDAQRHDRPVAPRDHGRRVDVGAVDRHLEGLRDPLAPDDQPDWPAGGAAELADDRVLVEPGQLHPVGADDHVADTQPGACRRQARINGDYLRLAALGFDGDADTAEPFAVLALLARLGRVLVARVTVEPGERAVEHGGVEVLDRMPLQGRRGGARVLDHVGGEPPPAERVVRPRRGQRGDRPPADRKADPPLPVRDGNGGVDDGETREPGERGVVDADRLDVAAREVLEAGAEHVLRRGHAAAVAPHRRACG